MYQFTGTARLFNGRYWSRDIAVRVKASSLGVAIARAAKQARANRPPTFSPRIAGMSVTLERLGSVLTANDLTEDTSTS